jgi:hypothetical protein
MSEHVKIVVTVPLTHADAVRKALGDAGAGAQGNYRFCSFSTRGHGRFLPVVGATPFIGEAGTLEVVEEERIEVLCERGLAKAAVSALIEAHPYEEPAWEVYPVLAMDSL